MYHTVAQKEIVALAVVRVSSGYFPVLECISYSTQEGLLFLARFMVSSQYFPVWIVYHTVAQERDRSSRCG